MMPTPIDTITDILERLLELCEAADINMLAYVEERRDEGATIYTRTDLLKDPSRFMTTLVALSDAEHDAEH